MTASNVARLPAPDPEPPQRKPKKKASASAVARQAEAEDGYVTVEQCGVELRIPVGGKITVSAVELFREGDNFGGTKEMIGDEQWQRLRDAGMTMDDLDELGGKLKAASGN